MQFSVKTNKREEIIDITSRVKELVERKKGKACLVYVPHATCAVIVNENYDQAVCEDILHYLREQIPQGKWKHDNIDNNADSHIKAILLGPSELIPMQNGELQLGQWQGIGLVELDGPRERNVVIEVL
ncbi:MAG: secondary thiamine-phosphate synthase enzyme YjbQ [Candidatus Thorarchaeota archaeon]|jgi:secondary thiamine-phosphate synthase enzyme